MLFQVFQDFEPEFWSFSCVKLSSGIEIVVRRRRYFKLNCLKDGN